MFGAFAFVIELERGRTIDHNALSTALVCVLLAGALALRRLSPGAALAVAWTGAGTQMAFARPPGFVDLAILAVLYATAAHGTRLVFWLGFASAIAGAIVITVYLFRGPFQPGYDPLSLIGPAAAARLIAPNALWIAPIAALLGVVSGIGGLWASRTFDIAAGGAVGLAAAAVFFLAFGVRAIWERARARRRAFETAGARA